jgi:hypothetical protein
MTSVTNLSIADTTVSPTLNTAPERDLVTDLAELACVYDACNRSTRHVAFALLFEAFADTHCAGDHAQAHSTLAQYLSERDDLTRLESAMLTHWRFLMGGV